MLNTIILKFVTDTLANWPTAILFLMLIAIYIKIHKYSSTQKKINLRVEKLVNIHAKRHVDDAKYLYDDSIEV